MVSGGGTNLQAVIDAIDGGIIRNAQIAVVISNKKMRMHWSGQRNMA